MKLIIYPKAQLENVWKKVKAQYVPEVEQPLPCLRCGQSLHHDLAANVSSRYINVRICKDCGADEILREREGNSLPLPEWQAVKNGLPDFDFKGKIAMLTPICSFPEVFENTQKEDNSVLTRPVSEVVFSRSDYDGYKWWSRWFDCQKEHPSPALCQEIDQFHNALFKMPEFKTLDTMRHLCRIARPTSCDSEFDFYSETAHFHIWLRLITRFRDYNLYVHYYHK